MAARIRITQVPRALRACGLTAHPPRYMGVYHAVVDALIPAEQDANGSWWVNEADLPVIAALLCPDAKPVAANGSRARRAS